MRNLTICDVISKSNEGLINYLKYDKIEISRRSQRRIGTVIHNQPTALRSLGVI